MIKTQEALTMVGGHVNEELLLRNEYLATENEILRNKFQSKISFSNGERGISKIRHLYYSRVK